jgi:Xaa-Pro dipeptidase
MINRSLVKKLTEELKKQNVDAILVAPGGDLRFLLGHTPILCERFQGMFIKSDGTVFYVCNALYEDEMSDLMEGEPIYSWHDANGFESLIKTLFEKYDLNGKVIAFNGNVRAFNLIKMLDVVNFTPVNGKDFVELLRIIKTGEELDNLRKAALIADKAFEAVVKEIRPGMSEKDVENIIKRVCGENGGENAGGIVAVDEHAALPHYFGKDGKVKENSVVLMDFGCTYKGMWSDTTRTIIMGKATDRQKYIYNLVLKANLAGEAAAKNGAWIPDCDAAARKVVEEEGLGKYFNHRLGHGIGYAPHEAPYIHGDYKMHLEAGMAFSCEPGIYIKDEIGVRIEDIVIINLEGETEILNKSTKELIEVPVK